MNEYVLNDEIPKGKQLKFEIACEELQEALYNYGTAFLSRSSSFCGFNTEVEEVENVFNETINRKGSFVEKEDFENIVEVFIESRMLLREKELFYGLLRLARSAYFVQTANKKFLEVARTCGVKPQEIDLKEEHRSF